MRVATRERMMTERLISITALVLIISICFLVPKAAAQSDKYPKMAPVDQYLMERNAEILLERSAAPDSISSNATILVLGRQGYETTVEKRILFFHGFHSAAVSIARSFGPAGLFVRRCSNRTSFTKDETESAPLAQIPVKHLHHFNGCLGVLKVYSDRLVFEAQDGHDSRSWRWTDIRAVGRPDIDRFEVLTFEPQTGGPKRSFNFILKEPLPDKMYDLIWSRVFRPTPLIRANGSY